MVYTGSLVEAFHEVCPLVCFLSFISHILLASYLQFQFKPPSPCECPYAPGMPLLVHK